MRACLTLALSSVLLAGLAGPSLDAVSPASPQLAKELTAVMSGKRLEAIAARDPDAADRVIAALAFPPSQLLVVSAAYPDGAAIDAWLASRMYREVYSALQQPSASKGKVFFQDLGCDGLQQAADSSVDVMYEDGKTQTIFDGNWKKQKLSQAEYQERLRGAEEKYSHLLRTLIDATQKGHD